LFADPPLQDVIFPSSALELLLLALSMQ